MKNPEPLSKFGDWERLFHRAPQAVPGSRIPLWRASGVSFYVRSGIYQGNDQRVTGRVAAFRRSFLDDWRASVLGSSAIS